MIIFSFVFDLRVHCNLAENVLINVFLYKSFFIRIDSQSLFVSLRSSSLIVLCVSILTNIGAMGDPGIIDSDSDSWSTNIFTLIISSNYKLFSPEYLTFTYKIKY